MWWHRDHVWASRVFITKWIWSFANWSTCVSDWPTKWDYRQKYREEKPVKKESLNSSLPGNMITIDENCKIVPSRAAAGRHVHALGIPSCLTFCLLITLTHHTRNLLSELSPSSAGIRDHHRFLLPPPFGRRTFYSFCQYKTIGSSIFKILARSNIYKICQLKAYIRVLRRH